MALYLHSLFVSYAVYSFSISFDSLHNDQNVEHILFTFSNKKLASIIDYLDQNINIVQTLVIFMCLPYGTFIWESWLNNSARLS